MRLYEIDSSSNEQSAQLKMWADTLRADCASYFSKTKNLMWRGIGIGVTLPPFSKHPCPRGRKPRDTNLDVHHVAGAWFVETFGVNYREDAMFATGSARQARSYGNMFAAFPVGDFRFCWSPMIADFTFDISDSIVDAITADDDVDEMIVDEINHAMYQTTDLRRAINSGHEIMIHCDEYYLLDAQYADQVMEFIW